jgi:2-dehydro-3-deoxyphosphogluconate aldolase / (4S)-4-hydroxy-2-oxoglutarate aldolase
MLSVAERYLSVHQQGFMPIFVHDAFDARMLVDCAVAAGAAAVEITCRRPEALAEIRDIRRAHPALIILAGSVVDGDRFVADVRRRQPAMPSINDLLEAGIDGIVSAFPIRLQTIERVSRTHLVIPGVETLTEAAAVIEAGAQFAKLFTADLCGGPARVARMTSAPTHSILPLFVTGGVTLARLPEYVRAGAAMLGSGWDVILGADYQAQQQAPNPGLITAALSGFLTSMQAARAREGKKWPATDAVDYLRRLPHFVPDRLLEEHR